METEDIRFWLKLVKETLAIRHEDTVRHLAKVCEMLPTVYTEKEEKFAHWQIYMQLQEVSGNIYLRDYACATRVFDSVNQEIQECLQKKKR